MIRYTEVKAQANKVMLAGIGGGCLLFAIGTLSKLPPLSVFGLLTGAGAGGVGYVMRENAKSQRNEDKIYVNQPKELETSQATAHQSENSDVAGMNKATAIAQINQQGKQKLSNKNTHFANINAAKNIYWFDIPIQKLSSNSYLHLLMYDRNENKLYHLEVPCTYLQENLSSFYIRQDKQAISLELSANIRDRFQDIRSGGNKLNFKGFLQGEYDYKKN